jgi:hypothetical protein
MKMASVDRWLGPSPFADVAPARTPSYGVQRLPM